MRALTAATIAAGLSGFVVLMIASRGLSGEEFAEFQAFWGLFFALAGVLDGITQETTRSVAAACAVTAETGVEGNPGRPGAPWRLAGAAAAVAALGAALLGPLWAPLLLDDNRGTAVGLLAAGLGLYAYQAALSGVLSGLGRWRRYAGLVALDAALRVIAALGGLAAGLGLVPFLIATVVGALAWVVVLAAGETRGPLRVVCDVPLDRLARRSGAAMLATGSSAAMITGFPVFIKATEDTAQEPLAAGLTVPAVLLAVSLTRAPILMPLQRLQSALVVWFVERRRSPGRALALPVGATLAAGAVGAALAWLIGPWLLEVFFAQQAPGLVLAALTFAGAFTGTLMITGCAALAAERHSFYVGGWALSSAVGFGVLALPLPLDLGVCLALIAGPLSGMALHGVALARMRPAPDAARPAA